MTTLEKELLADLRWIVTRLEIGVKVAASDALDQARAAIARSEQHADWQAEARARAARMETMQRIRTVANTAKL